jgi:microcystin-dependent protein
MASTYSTSLKLELIGSGDQSGTWGTTTNTNLGTLLEQAIVGQTTITMANADYTLTDYNGASDEARNAVIIISGSQNASYSVICPAVQKIYVITNSLSASATAYFKPLGGSALSIPNGKTVFAYCTGSAMVVLSDPTTVTNATNATNLIGSGTISSTSTATTQAAGTNNTTVATTAFVIQNSTPTGSLLMWTSVSAPTGYLSCDGSAVSRSTYSALYAVIGTAFGSGDGTTTFNLPNYANRMPIGVGSIAALAATGGSKDAVTVSHTHTITDPGHNHNNGAYSQILQTNGTATAQGFDDSPDEPNISRAVSMSTVTTGITINTTGVSGTNANLPPYLGVYFIIKT